MIPIIDSPRLHDRTRIAHCWILAAVALNPRPHFLCKLSVQSFRLYSLTNQSINNPSKRPYTLSHSTSIIGIPPSKSSQAWWYLKYRAGYIRQARYDSTPGNSSSQRQLLVPAVKNIERFWEMMAPDINRPFTSTRSSDIAIVAPRIRMTWKVFDPEKGSMSACGNGHGIPSIRTSMGLILHYINL